MGTWRRYSKHACAELRWLVGTVGRLDEMGIVGEMVPDGEAGLCGGEVNGLREMGEGGWMEKWGCR